MKNFSEIDVFIEFSIAVPKSDMSITAKSFLDRLRVAVGARIDGLACGYAATDPELRIEFQDNK